MNIDAIIKAGKAIDKAQRALKQLEGVKNLADALEAWEDFLNSFDRFFNKLEAGCKGHPKSAPWFGRITKLRGDDPLLTYLRQARNSDHHRIDDVAQHEGGGMRIGAEGALHLRGLKIVNGEVIADWTPASPGSKLIVTQFSSRLVAVPVTNKGVSFPVPTSHLGQPLPDANVLTLGKTAMEYAETLLQEAGQRGI